MAPLVPPSWLNDEFLQKALRSGRNDKSISVISSEVGSATAEGEHYASEMYRASIELKSSGREENVSVIIKAIHSSRGQENTKKLNNPDVFVKEINTLSTVIPAMENLLSKTTSDRRNPPFAAKHIYSCMEAPATVIVLEDLKKPGFRLAEPTIGLDLQHCLLVLRTIARYHATSLVHHENHPEDFTSFGENVQCAGENCKAAPFFNTSVKSCAKEVEKWPVFNEKYAERLHKIADNSMKTISAQIKRNESGFNVLTHGDLWKNNIMFKYSEETGEATDVRFVDFQLSHWTSPAVDLMYFLNSSASPDVMQQFDVLIKVYHNSLCQTLFLLGYEHLKPSLEVLNKEIDRKGLYGVISGTSVRILALVDRTVGSNMNEVIAGRQMDLNLSDAYKISLKHLLPFYEKRGWLNV